MATAAEPFSYVMAGLSERYTSEFPHPGIVPKYLQTVCDKTGVQLVSGVASLAIKGSWLSVSRARLCLTEFLATFRKADGNNVSNSVEREGERPKWSKARKRRATSSDDDSFDINNTCEPSDERTIPTNEKSRREGVSSWQKFTTEVLPQIQRTRSKREKVYSEPKDKSQKVPEPFVVVANFEPPTAKKVPKLDDIERVLKKVYQKDGSDLPTSVETQDSVNVDGESSENKSAEHEVLQNPEAKIAVNPLNSIHSSSHWSGGWYDRASSVIDAEHNQGLSQDNSADQIVGGGDSSAVVPASALHDHHQSLLSQAADADSSSLTAHCTQLSGEHSGDKLVTIFDNDAIAQDSDIPSNAPSYSLGNACEKDEERVEGEHSTSQDTVSSEKPVTVEPLISSSDADGSTPTQTHRRSRRKGWPKKKEKHNEKKTVEKTAYLKSTRAERAARRHKTSRKLSELSDSRRQTRHVTEEKSENTPIKPKRGRPSKPKSDTAEEEKEYQCSKCSYVAKKHNHLREHMRRVHITKEFRCDKCGKVFGFGKDLKRHRKTHLQTENRCDTCGKVYKGFRSLAEHKKIHADDYVKPEFPCEFCDKIFSTKYVLAYHIKSEHLGMKKTYICPTCGKSFSQKNSYLQHANVHMGIRPHQCDVCGKSFSYEKSLKEHKLLHEEGKQFECPICHKKFRQTSGMSIHMKIHKERKDYVCSACGKGFSQRQALVRHERIHGGEKPFACGLCQRTFTDSSILRRHMILIHKKDPKKWREDTVSSVKKRTDFFISVVMEDGDTMENDTSAEQSDKSVKPSNPVPPSAQLSEGQYGASQVNDISDNIIHTDDAESDGMKSELSVSFAPVGLQTQPLRVSTSVSHVHTEGSNVFTQGDSAVASITLPCITTDSLSQSPTLSQRLVPDEPIVSHHLPISFPHLLSLATHQSGEGQMTRPTDITSPGQAEISTLDDSQIQAQSPGLISLYADHHRLNPSDFFSSDSDHGIHLPYHSLLHNAAGVSGTFHSPVINNLLQNALSFHSEPLIASSSTSQSDEQPAGFEQLAGQNAMQESQYSPHNQNHQQH